MEKRMILAIVLSIVILLAYQKMFGPGPADRPPPAGPRRPRAPRAAARGRTTVAVSMEVAS